MAVPSPEGEVKIVSSISTFQQNTYTLDESAFSFNRCHLKITLFLFIYIRFFFLIFFFLFHLDKRLYSTSGGEVLFTKLDQEAEMDIKVTTTTKVRGGCFGR